LRFYSLNHTNRRKHLRFFLFFEPSCIPQPRSERRMVTQPLGNGYPMVRTTNKISSHIYPPPIQLSSQSLYDTCCRVFGSYTYFHAGDMPHFIISRRACYSWATKLSAKINSFLLAEMNFYLLLCSQIQFTIFLTKSFQAWQQQK